MVESNVGLGSALAEGTSLRGDFGNPISRGMQLNMQNDFAQLQQEQAKQAKLAKVEEDIAKFSSIDSGQWYDQERGRKVKKYIDENMAKAIEAKRSGNHVEAERIKQQIKNEVQVQRGVDMDHRSLNKPSSKSVTKLQAQKDYNAGGGVNAMMEDLRKYGDFSYVEDIDEESGSFKIKDIPNPRLGSTISREIKTRIAPLAKTKAMGKSGTANLYGIDKDSDAYKQERQAIIDKVLLDRNAVYATMHTPEFKAYYDDFLGKLGIDHEEANQADIDEAVEGYVSKVYDMEEAKNYVKEEKISSGGSSKTNSNYFLGGKNVGRWTFTPNENGATKVEVEGNASASPIFSGFIGDKKVDKKLLKPIVKYIGDDMFEVSGLEDIRGILVPTKEPIRIPKSEIVNIFKLSEDGLKANFAGYKPKGAAPKAQGKKESYPSWKAKNPSGTPAQYKTYLKS
jgi:hypothetical protein